MSNALGFVLSLWILLAAPLARAQQVAMPSRVPSARLVLTLPAPPRVAAAAATRDWLFVPLTLSPPALLATTLSALPPLHTDEGELSPYVALAPLATDGNVALTAEGSAAPKLELDCRGTCQPQLERAVALDARIVIAGQPDAANTAVFLRSEQTSARPRSDRRLRVGLVGAF